MTEYNLIASRSAHQSEQFDQGAIVKLMVKQLHLMMTKLTIVRDASNSARKREKLLDACAVLQTLIGEFQSGDLSTAVRNSDRAVLLFVDVELALESVASVVATSTDPSKAFWLAGSGNGNVDLSQVVKI